jgi:Helix-turn-helix domain of resolvase
VEAVLPPASRRGRFKAPDALIAALLDPAATSPARHSIPSPQARRRHSIPIAPASCERLSPTAFERELTRSRTGEGRERAKAGGVKMGRPAKVTPHQVKEALDRRDAGEPMRDVAKTYDVSHSTTSRLGALSVR